MRKQPNRGTGTCLLMLLAVLALAPQVQAQQANGEDEATNVARSLLPKKLVEWADKIDQLTNRSNDQDEATAGADYDEAAAKAAEADYQARQRAEHIARLQARTAGARAADYAECAKASEYVSSGALTALANCEREHLLPEEIRQRRITRDIAAKDRMRGVAANVGARDTVLMLALERDCPDNAAPSTYCREYVQKAEALGREVRALLDAPDMLAYLKSIDRDHMPASFFRARQVVLQPGAESYFREGMNDAGELVSAPATASHETSPAPEASLFLRRAPSGNTNALQQQVNDGIAYADRYDQRERAREAESRRLQASIQQMQAEREARERQAAQRQAQAPARQPQQNSGSNFLNTLRRVVETGAAIKGMQQQQRTAPAATGSRTTQSGGTYTRPCQCSRNAASNAGQMSTCTYQRTASGGELYIGGCGTAR